MMNQKKAKWWIVYQKKNKIKSQKILIKMLKCKNKKNIFLLMKDLFQPVKKKKIPLLNFNNKFIIFYNCL